MGIKIDIDYDVADDITVAVLRDSLESLAREVKDQIPKLYSLKDHELDDLGNSLEYLGNIKETLKYMTPHSKHKEIDDMVKNIVFGA